ncbi:MAG TPA: hypothetical protein PLR98_02475 [Chitinophagaceae bacterium]|nr:hypothetical protein [Chitinophagaceae bacterium]
MKKGNKLWFNVIWFLAGSFTCYITLQYTFFEIDAKLNIPETLISIGTAIIGLYIANTIQKRLTKNQNQYTYVEGKLDAIWAGFNNFSQGVLYNDSIEVNVLSKYSKEAIHSIGFVKSILISYELNVTCVSELETELESFEAYLLSLPISANIISTIQSKSDVEGKIVSLNQCFAKVLKLIHNI